jgi:AcrR family transcriptional regulator
MAAQTGERPHKDAAGPGDPGQITDRRLLKGTRTRESILRHAVDIASLDGLDGVSFGHLASASGHSKAGIQVLFKSKEALQLAVIEYARRMFRDAVTDPAQAAAPGAARLQALLSLWCEYATAPLFAGGCFWVANRAYFDSRPGPVRDALARDQRSWLALIATQFRAAITARQIAELDAELAAFQVDALLSAANTALRMGDDKAMDKARRITDQMLAPPKARP